MSYKRPTVLFVSGAWHQPSHFARVRKVFEDAGYQTSCPPLPSVGAQPPTGLKDDARRIRAELQKLVDEEGRDIIVIAHSYGGMVTSEAVDQDLAKSERTTQGKRGGVVHLVYMCAFMQPVGTTLAQAFDKNAIPGHTAVDDTGLCMMPDPAKNFYHDLPEEEREHWVGQLKECPAIVRTTPLTQAAYLYHPTTYLYCTNDAVLPLELQQVMVKNASETKGYPIATVSCPASHSPFLSMPERVLGVVQDIEMAPPSERNNDGQITT